MRKSFVWLLGLAALLLIPAHGTGSAPVSDDSVLTEATLAGHDIGNAINLHMASDPQFLPKRRKPEEETARFGVLIYQFPSAEGKKYRVELDWTPAQKARYWMEELRQGIYGLRLAPKNGNELDAMAIDHATEVWPKLRILVCQGYPGVRYFDLDGNEHFCPR